MLRFQAVSRRCYNNAEKINYFVWIISVISSACTFFPIFDGSNILSNIFIAFFNIAIVLSSVAIGRYIKYGSKLKNYFDAYVLNIEIDSFPKMQIRKLDEYTHTIMRKSTYCNNQTKNTGHDRMPGVKDWYEFSDVIYGDDAVFDCQIQNCWWTKKITIPRIVVSISTFVIAIILAVLLKTKLLPGHSIITFIFCLTPLAETFLSRLVENIRYYRLSLKIDNYIEILSVGKNHDHIIELQNLIGERRECCIMEINLFHKIKSRGLSELYLRIQK